MQTTASYATSYTHTESESDDSTSQINLHTFHYSSGIRVYTSYNPLNRPGLMRVDL